jgi:hypothetical protein
MHAFLFVCLTFSCAIGVLVLRFNFQQYCTYWQKRTNRRGLKNATLLTDPYATVKSVRESGHRPRNTASACLPALRFAHKSHSRECGNFIADGVDVVAVPDKVAS